MTFLVQMTNNVDGQVVCNAEILQKSRHKKLENSTMFL